MNTFTTNAAIFKALLARDMKVFKGRLFNLAIDSSILVGLSIVIFGTLIPMMGMSQKLIAPVFLGHSLSFFIASLGFNWTLRMTYDLKFDRCIDYFLTLPLPKHWLFTYYLASFSIEAIIVTLPMATIGIIALGDSFGPINGSCVLFLGTYFISLLFWGLFFLGSSFIYSYEWFKSNMWARRIMPLFILSTAYFTFAAIASVSPFISKLLMLNPVTYIIEGLRASLLGSQDYLPLSTCLIGSFIALAIMSIRLHYGIYKQLDPV